MQEFPRFAVSLKSCEEKQRLIFSDFPLSEQIQSLFLQPILDAFLLHSDSRIYIYSGF